jgi:hypothetical protein
MRLGHKRHFRRVSILLVLVLTVLGFTAALTTPVAHAAGIIFKAKADNPNGFSPMTVGPLTVALGDALIVNVMWFGTAGGNTVTDSQGNAYSLAVQSMTAQSSGANTAIYDAIAVAAGSDTVTVTRPTNNFVAAFLDYSGVASFGQTVSQQLDNAGNSGTSSVTLVNVATTSWIVENFMYETGAISGGVSANNGQNLRDNMQTSICATNGIGFCNSYDVPAPSSGFSLGLTYSSANCNAPGCFASHSALELSSGAPGTTQTVTQCFGNCGAPAITLVNTNSTHTVNFNTSITLFYQVQLSVTGFMLNVTTNLAKTYSNSFSSPFLGFYRAQCAIGITPGTNACPFILQEGVNTGALGKGRVSMTGGGQYPVVAGDWIGIAVSAQISGLDLNDTNSNVPMLQASGIIPAAITQTASFSAASKIGLWTWIQSTTITSLPPPIGSGVSCFGLDCILSKVVNSSCQIATTACQTGSSIFWVIILTIISVTALVMALSELLPGQNIGRMGIGELAILFFIGWVVIFTSFSLLSIYVLLLVFFVVAAISAKTVRGYVGI